MTSENRKIILAILVCFIFELIVGDFSVLLFKVFKLACYVGGEYLHGSRYEFYLRFMRDINYFIEKSSRNSVLVFSPFSSQFRYVAHKTIEDYFTADLCSFSFGPDEQRRLIIGYSDVVIRNSAPFICIHKKLDYFDPQTKQSSCTCSLRFKSAMQMAAMQEGKSDILYQEACESVQADQSPDCRTIKKSCNLPKSSKFSKSASFLENNEHDPRRMKQKRPDMQLYVPRAMRLKQQAVLSEQCVLSQSAVGKVTNSVDNVKNIIDKSKLISENISKKDESVSATSHISKNAAVSKEQLLQKSKNVISVENEKICNPDKNCLNTVHSESILQQHHVADIVCDSVNKMQNDEVSEKLKDVSSSVKNESSEFVMPDCTNKTQIISVFNHSCDSLNQVPKLNMNLSDCPSVAQNENVQDDNKNTGNEISSVILSHLSSSSFVSEVLAVPHEHSQSSEMKSITSNKIKSCSDDQSSSNDESDLQQSNNKLINSDLSTNRKINVSCVTTKNNAENIDSTSISHLENKEADSWDAMFNEDGECLNPKMSEKLSALVGDVEVHSAKENYEDFRVCSETDEELNHILEIYNFPVEFSTQDLIAALSCFRNQDFNIVWVDDCHALGVFASVLLAMQALDIKHPVVKLRPISQGIKESKMKAKKVSKTPLTFKPRPATSVILAHRLVSGALGLKVTIPKEQREREKQKLKEAKEQKKNAAKQRQNIWDGVVS